MKFSIFRQILLIIVLLGNIHLIDATDIVRFVASKKYPDPKQSYFIDLLTLTLEASKKNMAIINCSRSLLKWRKIGHQ
ncbi:MAG: hypothetical protein COB83_01455 [Gammaproteobacteria bacterium]|nr:MAG: hypothetical protein COB83_01455 [Gammaproteobacteria bacterium]